MKHTLESLETQVSGDLAKYREPLFESIADHPNVLKALTFEICFARIYQLAKEPASWSVREEAKAKFLAQLQDTDTVIVLTLTTSIGSGSRGTAYSFYFHPATLKLVRESIGLLVF